jgi:hypothetical protein
MAVCIWREQFGVLVLEYRIKRGNDIARSEEIMALIELIYFVITANLAALAARWVYLREGWILAILTFILVWGPCIRFFFTGGFRRLVVFLSKPSNSKD